MLRERANTGIVAGKSRYTKLLETPGQGNGSGHDVVEKGGVMSTEGLWPSLTARVVETPRLRQFVIEGGDPDGVPVLFIHGNVSANPF